MQGFGREWLVTNGLGSYASSTESGANTRHYHGLLVASFNPPTDRKVVVAKIEERVFVNGEYCDLSTNQYPNVIHPDGRPFLKEFNVKPFPNWQYENENWELKKSICMVADSNTILVNYTNNGTTPIVLELHPLYSYTDYHKTFHENPSYGFYTEFTSQHLKTFAQYGAHPIFTKWSAGEYTEARNWYKNFQLPKSKSRGVNYECDYYRIGFLKKELKPNEQVTICFSTEENILQKDIDKLWTVQKRKTSRKPSVPASVFYNDLLYAGNQFLVERKSTKNKSIIAGYHWFTDWGRDTMIAMRGLTIATGRKAISKSILTTFFKSVDQGMLPDYFPDQGNGVPYNAMDATLWLFVATYEYYLKFKDLSYIKQHLNVLQEILEWHIKGTRYNIHVTEEGFLYGGQEGEQLTWMDAIVQDKVITPRIGCPVGVNALWYNALKIQEFFCKEFDLIFDKKYKNIIASLEVNFPTYFINPEGTLYDVIVPKVSLDNSFRPNQLFWLSLPFTVLSKEQQMHIFKAVKEKLYTPYGLRTLDIEDPNFIGTYTGDQWQRDHAYHQGTVWPFLLYDYHYAFLSLYGNTKKNRTQVKLALTHLEDHFYNHQGLHCISEIFDGSNPYEGKGCIQQAWSVAALIKLYADYKLYELDGS